MVVWIFIRVLLERSQLSSFHQTIYIVSELFLLSTDYVRGFMSFRNVIVISSTAKICDKNDALTTKCGGGTYAPLANLFLL